MALTGKQDLSADALNTLEPQRTNNWTLDVTGLTTDENISITLGLQAFQLPTETSDLIEVYYMNERRQYAGRTMYDGGTLSLTDWIDQGTADVIRAWRKEVYDPYTGKIGIKSKYAKRGTINLYAPGGETAAGKPTVTKTWTLINLWPVSVTWGNLDMQSSDKVQIEVQMVYDKAQPLNTPWKSKDI